MHSFDCARAFVAKLFEGEPAGPETLSWLLIAIGIGIGGEKNLLAEWPVSVPSTSVSLRLPRHVCPLMTPPDSVSRELRYGSFSAVMLFLLNLLLMEIYAPLRSAVAATSCKHDCDQAAGHAHVARFADLSCSQVK